MSLKIATWNVNSLRVRLPHVLSWLASDQPDILALQEIKLPTIDNLFTTFEEAGYVAIASGQKAYNGVAILSRKKPEDIITDLPELDDPQRRVLAATIDQVRIINLYVPNGENLSSLKYQYKLNWLRHCTSFLRAEINNHKKVVVVGDFNIAPAAIDVHDPELWTDRVLVSDPERQAFRMMLDSGLHDCLRYKYPGTQFFSWWDYRLNAFRRNLGLRIDHILTTPTLSAACTHCYIDPKPRALERPSDHAPVIAEFNLP